MDSKDLFKKLMSELKREKLFLEEEEFNDMTEMIERKFDEGGIAEVVKYFEKERDMWKKIPVNIGVVGRTGVGKSTFINAYRNIEYDDDDDAAPVGVTQTTMKAESFPDAKNENIVLWDVPGVGTEEFPRQTYLKNKKVSIDQYDFIIIITATRFTEDEMWLHKQMKNLKKPAFLVRSKMLQDMANEKRRKKANIDKTDEVLIRELIKKCKDEMKSDVTNVPVYFIDSFEKDHPQLQFEELLDDMVKEAPKAKRAAVLFNIETHLSKIIERKKEALKKRRWWITFSSMVESMVNPANSDNNDSNFGNTAIEREIKLYRAQLGLEENRVSHLSNRSQKMHRIVDMIKIWSGDVVQMLKNSFGNVKVFNVNFPVPFLGLIREYRSRFDGLGRVVDKMAADVVEFQKVALKEDEVGDNC